MIILWRYYPGYISQLTTPCATPFLSLDNLSPRTLSDTVWNDEDGLPWMSLGSAVSDRPLYESYYLGLDKIGLDNEENNYWNHLSNNIDMDVADSESDSIDTRDVPERSQSAPLSRTKRLRNFRPKSCFPLLCN